MLLIVKFPFFRFRVTKVEHKSASKEHKNVASASGEKLATPIKEGLPAVRQASRELRYTPVKQEEKERSGTE